jgi:energy-coupling factor transporter transmembrane protein EcfT
LHASPHRAGRIARPAEKVSGRFTLPCVTDAHRLIGYSISAVFLLLALWTLFAFVTNKHPGRWFWTLLGVVQGVVVLQVVVGAVLFIAGERPPSVGDPPWLHYVYGGLFPAFVLTAAHRFARKYEDIPWVIFGIASLVCAASTFRAMQSALGWFQ